MLGQARKTQKFAELLRQQDTQGALLGKFQETIQRKTTPEGWPFFGGTTGT